MTTAAEEGRGNEAFAGARGTRGPPRSPARRCSRKGTTARGGPWGRRAEAAPRWPRATGGRRSRRCGHSRRGRSRRGRSRRGCSRRGRSGASPNERRRLADREWGRRRRGGWRSLASEALCTRRRSSRETRRRRSRRVPLGECLRASRTRGTRSTTVACSVSRGRAPDAPLPQTRPREAQCGPHRRPGPRRDEGSRRRGRLQSDRPFLTRREIFADEPDCADPLLELRERHDRAGARSEARAPPRR